MIEVFYLTVALLLLLLFFAAGAVLLRCERLVDQLPPVLLTGSTGAGILLLLGPIWDVRWLTDVALLISSATLGLVIGITRRVESARRDDHA